MKINNWLLSVKNNLAMLLLVMFFISEGLSKYSIYHLGEKFDFPRIIKCLVLLFLAVSLLKNTKLVIRLSFLLISFLLGQFFLSADFNQEVIVSFAKFLFSILLFVYFNKNPIDSKTQKNLFLVFETLILANCVLILFGAFFDLYIFKTYKSLRFGYNGLFITSATGSYVYSITVFYFLFKLKSTFFKNWKVFLVLLTCVLLGTKIIYITLIVALLVYLFFFSDFDKWKKIIFTMLSIILLFALSYLVFIYSGSFFEIMEDRGLISSIFSFRNDLLLKETLPYIKENWNFGNYLFGGLSNLSLRSQLGFFDVFFFWGILGGIIYLFFYYKSFITFKINQIILVFIITFSSMIFLSGNFFENASVAIYMLVIKEIILANQLVRYE